VLVDPALSALAFPALYTLFLWWFSTGAILYLDGLPRRTFPWSLLGASVLLAFALRGLATSSVDTSVAGAYVAFSCSLVVWGWNEMAFLMGYATGSRRSPCPRDCRGWRHFGHAAQAILHHELALLLSGAVVAALTWGGPNQLGTWTFLVLWAMRLSTKLNVFLGVPNLTEEFLPEHLAYLRSFFRNAPMNLLFPLSITVSTAITVLVARATFAPQESVSETTRLAFVLTLMALGVLEHWLLVVPLPAASLWSWGLRSREQASGSSQPEAAAPAPDR